MNVNSPEILIIEDNEDDEFFLLRALKAADAPEPSWIWRTGREAMDHLQSRLEFAEGGGELPDLVLLDLHLPDIAGLDVLRWMRRQPRLEKLIVVLLTGSREELTLHAAHDLGANAYIVKPPSADSIRVLLKALDRYHVEFETG